MLAMVDNDAYSRSPSMASTQSCDAPSKAEWNVIRPTFEHLYVRQGKILAEVIEELREKHNFHATQQMFKRRIKTWGLAKNLKGDEVQSILDIAAARQASGKATHEVLLRGRHVTMEAVLKSQSRRKALVHMAMVSHKAARLDRRNEHVRAVSPPPPPPADFDRMPWASPDKGYEDTLRRFGAFYGGLIDAGYYSVRSGEVVSPRTLVNVELSDICAALFMLKPESNMLVIRKLALVLESIVLAVDAVTHSWLIHALQLMCEAGHASTVTTLLLHMRQLARYVGRSQRRINFLQSGGMDPSRSQQLVTDGLSVRVAMEQKFAAKTDPSTASLNSQVYEWFWQQRGYPSQAPVNEVPANAPQTLVVLDRQHRASGLFAFGTLVLMRIAIRTDSHVPMVRHLIDYLQEVVRLTCDFQTPPCFYFDGHFLSRQSATELAAIYCDLGLHETEKWLLERLLSVDEGDPRWQDRGQYSLLVCATNCPVVRSSEKGLVWLKRKQDLEDSWRMEIRRAAPDSELFSSPGRPAVVVP